MNLTASSSHQGDPCQGDLSTLANVVTSLAHLNKAREMADCSVDLSGMETLSNGDGSIAEIPSEEQNTSDITRYGFGVSASTVKCGCCISGSVGALPTLHTSMSPHPLLARRAFDTLAKALNPAESASGEAMEASMRLVSGDQSGGIVELEGPLLCESHVPFKVSAFARGSRRPALALSWRKLILDQRAKLIGPPLRFCLQLMMPLPMPEYLNVNYICESASRLLFLSMHWARSIPAFQALG